MATVGPDWKSRAASATYETEFSLPEITITGFGRAHSKASSKGSHDDGVVQPIVRICRLSGAA